MSDAVPAPSEPGTPDASVAPAEGAPAPSVESPAQAPTPDPAPAAVQADSTPPSAPEPAPLPTVEEAHAERELDAKEREIETTRQAINVAPAATDSHTVGLRHSDTITINAPKIADEGPRQEQIHVNL